MLLLSQNEYTLVNRICKFFIGEDRPAEIGDARAAFEPVRQRPEIFHIPLNFDASGREQEARRVPIERAHARASR